MCFLRSVEPASDLSLGRRTPVPCGNGAEPVRLPGHPEPLIDRDVPAIAMP